ncbi:MAG: amino acid ABC transporter substrate-binding protein [Acidobacteria bacterium]|nr:amino acid ABC transporter substrate-binding protein [Acidobacteriota bacterium]
MQSCRCQLLSSICVTSVMALSACAPGRRAPESAGDQIVVGTALPLSGGQAREGGYFKKAYELAWREANDAGGIMVDERGKKLPVHLIIYDDKSDPTTSVQLYEKLATEDRVHFFLGGYSTPLVQAQTVVPEKYQVPYITGGGATAEIYARGMKYIFGLLADISKLAATLTKWLALQQDAGKLPKLLKIAVVTENTSHGREFARGIENAAGTAPDRFKMVFNEAFEQNIKDADPLLQKAKAASADVFLADARVADYITVQRRYAELQLQHLIISYGPRGPEKEARDALGPASDYIISASWWDKDLKDEASQAFLRKYREAYHDDPEWFAALGYESARVLFAAIANAGTLDRVKVRAALANMRLSPSLVVGGVVQFGPNGQIQNEYVMMQNLPDGKSVIIYPPNLATGEAIVPVPRR